MDIQNTLQLRLSVLMEGRADGFDPARWCYIASLVRRARGKQDGIKHRIERIALKALDDYQHSFDRERVKAAEMMSRAASEFPDAAEPMRTLFEQNNFSGMRRLLRRLSQQNRSGILIPLTDRIMSGARALQKKKTPLTFDDMLQQQDAEVLQSVGGAMAPHTHLPQTAEKAGLNTIQLFRKTWSKLYSDRLVARAVKDRPENAGPLNSQMLATRSLFIMRKLSPSYLNRFVSYIDTLLWLEQAGAENTPRTDKKRKRSIPDKRDKNL
jgi:hypothetical protein